MCDYFTSDIYLKGALFLLVVRVIAAVGVFRLIKLLYAGSLDFKTVLVTAFYLLSPAYYNGNIYWLVYAFIPWLLYSVVQVIKSGKLNYSDVLLINLVLFGMSADLPNPKYLFHAVLIIVLSLGIAAFLGILERKFYTMNKHKILLAVTLSSYLFVPLAFFAFNYDPVDYGGVTVKRGYVNDTGAAMMDFRSSTADRMVRLFHDGMVIDPSIREDYLTNPLIVASNFFFISLIVLYFLLKKQDKNPYDYLLMFLSVIYLFFSIGPNPPFGFIYERIVASLPVFAFFRTTAGAVFYLSLFYSLLIYSALNHFRKAWLYILCAAALVITAYPMIDGSYYRNWSNLNKYVDKGGYGMKVPGDYFKLREVFDPMRLDAKVYVTQSDLSYLNTTWGYFGPGWLYNALYKGNFIDSRRIFSTDVGIHNVGYVFTDRTVIDGPVTDAANSNDTYLIAGNNVASVYRKRIGTFVPRIYIPSKIVFAGESSNSALDSISIDPDYLVQDIPLVNRPVVEYVKIAPTKYRVVLHGIKEDFILVLAEQFHRQWSIYIVDAHSKNRLKVNVEDVNSYYKILENNEDEQASASELKKFISNGWIATIGNGKEKRIDHYSYSDISRTLRSSEAYKIDFVSKMNLGTIQNNNLGELDTWDFAGEVLATVPHIKVNQYGNAWFISKKDMEQKFPDYLVRGENGLDMELVIEFFPQKVFYYSVAVSLASFLVIVFLGIRKIAVMMARRDVPTPKKVRHI